MTDIARSPQDKAWWYNHGETEEHKFVNSVAPAMGLDAIINPAKESEPWQPDLIVNGSLADLKRQTTPFFTAGRYDLSPQYTVTFNAKDIVRYINLYDHLAIYFWVSWPEDDRYNVHVNKMTGVWKSNVKELAQIMNREDTPWHQYQNRGKDDPNRNAKSSFLIDLRQLDMLYYNGFGEVASLRVCNIGSERAIF